MCSINAQRHFSLLLKLSLCSVWNKTRLNTTVIWVSLDCLSKRLDNSRCVSKRAIYSLPSWIKEFHIRQQNHASSNGKRSCQRAARWISPVCRDSRTSAFEFRCSRFLLAEIIWKVEQRGKVHSCIKCIACMILLVDLLAKRYISGIMNSRYLRQGSNLSNQDTACQLFLYW